MSADKTKAVLSIGIKMFPFQISYVKNMLSEIREEFLQCRCSDEEESGLSPSNFRLQQRPWEVAATRPLGKSEQLPGSSPVSVR